MRWSQLLVCSLLSLGLMSCEPQTIVRKSNGPAYLPEGAVFPSSQTIGSGKYKPLSRPLFLYVNKAALKRPEVAAFLQYYLSDEGRELVADSGYISLSDDAHAQQVKLLQDAIAAAGTEDTKDLSGQVMIDGSSTVAPISAAVAEEFSRMHRETRVPLGTSGTGGGFKKFCADEIDICDASREIKDSEKKLCEEAGIEYLELEIALDGLTVVVNPANDWIDGLTIDDLEKIWNPESTVHLWSDVNPAFPDEDIKLFGPDTDSGTFEYFTEVVCHKKGASRSDYQQSTDDNFLVTGVAGDELALGYFGFAYYVENKDRLKALAIAP